MPEMPEIKAHSERMAGVLADEKLEEFQLLKFSVLKTFDPKPDDLINKKVVAVSTRGKYLIIEFEDSLSCVIHLMQGGRLKPEALDKISSKPKFGLARFIFCSESGEKQSWLFSEAGSERKASIWIIKGDYRNQLPISKIGPDIDSLGLGEFSKILNKNSKRIHGLLRSQSEFSGIGRMLANEICHTAKLSPFANASKLSNDQIKALYDAAIQCVNSSLMHERTLDEIGKSQDRPSKVHNHKNEECQTCKKSKILTVEYNRYTVFYCPTCQTDGKILSDNTTSKFLK